MSRMKIWGAGTTRSHRPIWMAEELGLDYEHKPIGPRTGETQTPEYTELNRKQKIPFLEDGDIHLSESVAISRHLLVTYGADSNKGSIWSRCSSKQKAYGVWKPVSPKQKAKEDEWVFYIYGELDETSLYVMRRHNDLAEIYGASETAVKSSAAYLQRHLGILAQHLEGRQHLMDDGFGLPDLLLVTCLDWALAYGVDVPAPVLTYRQLHTKRPAYKSSVFKNYPKEIAEELTNGTA